MRHGDSVDDKDSHNLATSSESDCEIRKQARAWVVKIFSSSSLTEMNRLGLSGESEAAQEAFFYWLAADERHFEAYEEAERVWLGIGELSHLRAQARYEDLQKFAVSHSSEKTKQPFSKSMGRIALATVTIVVGVIFISIIT